MSAHNTKQTDNCRVTALHPGGTQGADLIVSVHQPQWGVVAGSVVLIMAAFDTLVTKEVVQLDSNLGDLILRIPPACTNKQSLLVCMTSGEATAIRKRHAALIIVGNTVIILPHRMTRMP
jgi:hypothetical protein